MFILYYKMVINAISVYLLIQNKENIHLIQLGTAVVIFITFNKQCNMVAGWWLTGLLLYCVLVFIVHFV